MKRNKETFVASILAILSLILITLGMTYAVFTYTKLGTTDNTITSGTLKFLYTENTGVPTGIKLTNALPISDTQGKELDGDNNVFDFSIEATNTGTKVIPYEVTLRKKDTSTLNEEYVKVYLTDRTESTEKEELEVTKYSELTQTNINVGNNIEKTIYNSNVASGETEYRKDFRLRMWISDDVSQENINNKEFTATVNIYANAKVMTEEEKKLISSADIENIVVGDNNFTEVEDKDWNYEVVLDSPSASVLNVISKCNLASVKIEKDGVEITNNDEITSVMGDNIYKVTITSFDKKQVKVYLINIRVVQIEKVSIFNKNYEVVDAKPTLTASSNNTSDASGLYKSTDTNSGSPTYYFRGNVENNYVKFAGETWRIVRVNEDGTIRIIMQDGINNSAIYNFSTNNGNYSYMYYSNSNAKTQLDSWYQTNIESKTSLASKVATGDYYCEQAKVKYNKNWTSENATMEMYTSYTPNFKCSNDENGKGIVNSSVGLLSYDEAVYAGGYAGMNNDNYYLYNSSIPWWTMSPAGVNGSYSYVWCVVMTGGFSDDPVGSNRRLRAVLILRADTPATGSGTSTDPFVIS